MPHSPNELPFWFEQDRAKEIIADTIATNGACHEHHAIRVRATFAAQTEQGVEFRGPLIDELAEMRAQILPALENATDWHDKASVDRYRTQRASVTELLLAALDWRPNGGGSHEGGLEAFFRPRADARQVAA